MRYRSDRPTRRFVAGASCPFCQAKDSVVLVQNQGDEYIECALCKKTQARPRPSDLAEQNDETRPIKFTPRA